MHCGSNNVFLNCEPILAAGEKLLRPYGIHRAHGSCSRYETEMGILGELGPCTYGLAKPVADRVSLAGERGESKPMIASPVTSTLKLLAKAKIW